MSVSASDKQNYFIQSVAKAFELLEAFDSESTAMSIIELEKKTAMNKATVRRYVLTLVDLGYLASTDNKKFKIGPKALDLGAKYLGSFSLQELSLPLLNSLSNEIEESTSIAILDKSEIQYIVRVNPSQRYLDFNIKVGSRLPYYATSLGKALVAWLPENVRKSLWNDTEKLGFTKNTLTNYDAFEISLAEIRNNGYAFSEEELELGVLAMAVPIFDSSNNVIAAMSVSSHMLRNSKENMLNMHLEKLLDASGGLSEKIKIYNFKM